MVVGMAGGGAACALFQLLDTCEAALQFSAARCSALGRRAMYDIALPHFPHYVVAICARLRDLKLHGLLT